MNTHSDTHNMHQFSTVYVCVCVCVFVHVHVYVCVCVRGCIEDICVIIYTALMSILQCGVMVFGLIVM